MTPDPEMSIMPVACIGITEAGTSFFFRSNLRCSKDYLESLPATSISMSLSSVVTTPEGMPIA